MKLLKALFALAVACAILFSTSLQFSSCNKKQVIQDTTIVRDTTVVIDSIYDLTDGLVAYYNFNGGSLMDSSGYGNNIIFNNATQTSDRFGKANNAYQFNGTSSYMRVANNPTLNPNSITLMAIVKINGFYTGTCHDNQILGKLSSDPEDGVYMLRFLDFTTDCSNAPNTSVEQFYGLYGDNIPQGAGVTVAAMGGSSTAVQTGQWYNVVFTYDGINGRLYINGALQNTIKETVPFTQNADDLYIGATPNSTYPYYFNGVIDEIRIYNRALSANEINQLKNVQE